MAEEIDYGSEFVKLTSCMNEISNSIHKPVQLLETLNHELKDIPKRLWLQRNPAYRWRMDTCIETAGELVPLTTRIVEDQYGEIGERTLLTCGGLVYYPPHIGMLPGKDSHEKANWIDFSVDVESSKEYSLEGQIDDNGRVSEPNIEVELQKKYICSPQSFLTIVKSVDGLEIIEDESKVSFKPKGKSWVKDLLDKHEVLDSEVEKGEFSAEIFLKRDSKYFVPDKTRTKEYGSKADFNVTASVSPTSKEGTNASVSILYRISANRLDVNLPGKEIEWVKNAVNTLAH